MGYKALYRLYRPNTFEQVVGQKYIVKTLKNAIKKDHIAHAYIFCGPRGIGKTSIAKIFAKTVNCTHALGDPCNACESCVSADEGSHPDIIEMDAASNNGVDKIRELIEQIAFSPMVGKYKVYIIDEVHMLSAGAFNALLKTLEEPPAHVIFILATTNPEKVLPTILSRCQRFDFGRVEEDDIFTALKRVADSSNINADDDALRLIARLADGGMRDALSILDQCYAYEAEHLTEKNVEDIYGLVSIPKIMELLQTMKKGDTVRVVSEIQGYIQSGTDVQRFVTDLTNIMKDLMVYKYTFALDLMSTLNEEEVNSISQSISKTQIQSVLSILVDVNEKLRFSNVSTSYFEVGIMKIMDVLSNEEESLIVETTKKKEKESNDIKEISKTVIKNSVKDNKSNNESKDDVLVNVLEKSNSKILEITKNVSRETFLTEEDKEEVKNSNNHLQNNQDDIVLDDELLLSILVGANRTYKEEDNKLWSGMDFYKFDPQYSVYVGMMTSSSIVASSADCVIISVLTKGSANMLNQANDEGILQNLMAKVLKVDKEVVALTNDETKQLIELFRKRREAGTLPEAYVTNTQTKQEFQSVREEQAKKIELSPLDRVYGLFGEGNVDVVEGEYHER